jgi:peptidoglycan/LPS O-acetylase OafA/YrhL
MLAKRRILGLDSLRFICALWVVLHHGARPEIAAWMGWGDVAVRWNAIAFDGVAAVIVFFVISGLVIHYPYARGERLHLPSFYAHRFIRIGIPMLLIRVLAGRYSPIVSSDIAHATEVVLWSLWCELAYYAIYPALLVGFRKLGLRAVLAASFILAYALIAINWKLPLYYDYSHVMASLVALPAWLVGCAIAQAVADGKLPRLPGSVWLWRVGALLFSILAKALVYRSITPILIGNPATLGIFAVYAAFWIIKEIQTFDVTPPPRLLEWGGRWSYSLYLVHAGLLVSIEAALPGNPLIRSPLQIAAALALGYAFYLTFERPARLLAVYAGRRPSKSATHPPRVNPVDVGHQAFSAD